MKIALIGYGKMGKAIESLALERNHEIVLRVNSHSSHWEDTLKQADVAIEFTHPKVALNHIITCLNQGVPVVSGSTGWLEQYTDVVKHCQKLQGCFFYASNFSLGVNLFFQTAETLAKQFASLHQYHFEIKEWHHIHKKDAPSGTAITLAEKIIKAHGHYSQWQLNPLAPSPSMLPIYSYREGEIPGTHQLIVQGPNDKLLFEHKAENRLGFAEGAVMAAEFVKNRRGVFGMEDLLQQK